jgi:hypothetical protein
MVELIPDNDVGYVHSGQLEFYTNAGLASANGQPARRHNMPRNKRLERSGLRQSSEIEELRSYTLESVSNMMNPSN